MKKVTLTLILLAVAVCLTAVLASCSCGSETPAETTAAESSSVTEGTASTPDTTVGKQPATTTSKKPAISENPVISEVVQTTGTTPVSTSGTPTSDTTPGSTTASTKLPSDPIEPWTEKTDESGMLSLSADAVTNGLLLWVDEEHAYTGELFGGNKDTTADAAIQAGFTHISSTFRTVDNNHFLRNEAMEALQALIAAFDLAAGTDKPFRVEGYTASVDPTSAFVTGNVLKLRIFANDVTYGLNYGTFQVSLNGEMVTYDKWFEATAAAYGFLYEGLVGEENNAAGQLRYVGALHATGIIEAGSLEAYLDAIKNKTVTTATLGEDTWNLYYVKLSQVDSLVHYTVLDLGADATYTVSGDNNDGVIVAVKQAIAE